MRRRACCCISRRGLLLASFRWPTPCAVQIIHTPDMFEGRTFDHDAD
jgi:hypothetical protein